MIWQEIALLVFGVLMGWTAAMLVALWLVQTERILVVKNWRQVKQRSGEKR
jgi:hypothetical protein